MRALYLAASLLFPSYTAPDIVDLHKYDHCYLNPEPGSSWIDLYCDKQLSKGEAILYITLFFETRKLPYTVETLMDEEGGDGPSGIWSFLISFKE